MARSDKNRVEDMHGVECLRCGSFRVLRREREERLQPGDCPRCGYVGWALATDLSEQARRSLRERSFPHRRLRVVY